MWITYNPVFTRCGLHCDPHRPVCGLLLQCHHCLVTPLPVLLHDKWAAMAQLWQQLEQPELHWPQTHQQIHPHQWILHQVQDHTSSRILWVSDHELILCRSTDDLESTLPGRKKFHLAHRAYLWLITAVINMFHKCTRVYPKMTSSDSRPSGQAVNLNSVTEL